MGGYDGGVFVLLSPAKPNRPTVYSVRIFHEDGDVWYQGPLELDRGPPLDVNDRGQFSAWDGDALLLRDGRVLNRPKTAGR